MTIITEISILLLYAFFVLIFCFFGKWLLTPGRLLFRFLLNSLGGCLFLLLFNLTGSFFGLHIPLNLFTLIVSGLLGLPGIGLLLFLL